MTLGVATFFVPVLYYTADNVDELWIRRKMAVLQRKMISDYVFFLFQIPNCDQNLLFITVILLPHSMLLLMEV